MGIVLLVLTALMVGLDQLLKYLAVLYLKPLGNAPFIPGVLGFNYTENTGAAFSLLAGKQGFLIIVTGIALLGWAYFLFFKRPKSKMEIAGMVLVLAGGLGNLIDRIVSGFVVDYIELLFMHFAVFNLADIFVCVGFALLIVGVLRTELKNKKLQAEEPTAKTEHPDEND